MRTRAGNEREAGTYGKEIIYEYELYVVFQTPSCLWDKREKIHVIFLLALSFSCLRFLTSGPKCRVDLTVGSRRVQQAPLVASSQNSVYFILQGIIKMTIIPLALVGYGIIDMYHLISSARSWNTWVWDDKEKFWWSPWCYSDPGPFKHWSDALAISLHVERKIPNIDPLPSPSPTNTSPRPTRPPNISLQTLYA